MRDLVRLIVWAVVDLFRSRAAIEAEILTLRQQIIVLRRTAPKKQSFGAIDRLVFVGLYRLFPRVLDAVAIVRPATVIKWHRAGFRLYWRWKSQPRGGRPPVPSEIRRLIREMSIANPLWGAPRIHGELLKLGIAIGQTSVGKYMAKRRGAPSQGWKTFRRNHADGIATMDLFVVPTISFRLLYGLLIMGHDRRQVIWLGVTTHPTAEWIANQLTEACGWEQLPRYLIRDRDAAYGDVFIRRVRSMGIRDQPTRPRSADRFDPTGMPRPRCRVRQVPPPPPVAVIHNILQWRPDTSRLGEGCAVLAYRRTSRANCLPPYSRRAAPPICPHLIFDRHNGITERSCRARAEGED